MLSVNVLKFLIVIAFVIKCVQGYEIPTPTFELLSPKGFKISIPHEPGIVFVAFHGAINRELKGIQPGDFSGEGTAPVNGKWEYSNTKVILEPGDVLSYWIHVQHGNAAYRLLEKSITIPGSSENSTPKLSTINQTPRPIVTIGPVLPTGNIGNDNGIRNCVPSKTIVRGRTVCVGDLIFEDNFDILNWTQWKREIRIPLDSVDADFVSFQNRPENCYISSGRLHIVPNLLDEVPGFNEDKIRMGLLDLGPECTAILDVEKECRRQARHFRILPPIVSARIRTKEFFSFKYGKVEVRARLTRGDWLFPQIFLEPYTSEYGINGYSSGQMRIAFIRGNEILETSEGNQIDGHRLSGGVVLTKGDTFRDIWLRSSFRAEHLGRNFHTYTFIWDDDHITLAVDGNEYATIRGGFSRLSHTHNVTYATQWESGGFMAPFDKEFYIALGVSAGGISDFPDECRNGPARLLKPWANGSPKAELKFWGDRENWYKTWEGTNAGMEVDYIKVWAL